MHRYREIQAFDAVVHTGSLAAAARYLECSPATIMRTIASLESRLGNMLLIRGPRGVKLSPAGARFGLSCRQILQQTEHAERSAAGLHASPCGQLTVSVPLLMSAHIFTPVALAYLESFADVKLNIQAQEGVPKLLEDGIDVALVVSHLPNSSGYAMPLGVVRPMVCASPDYLSTWGCPETPEDLKSHRTLATTSLGYEAEWRFRCERSTRPVKLAPTLRCTTQRAALQAAMLGLGLVRCMSYEVHDELQSGLLIPVLTAFSLTDIPVQLLYRDGRRAQARVRSFIDFATPRLRAHPAFIA